MDHEFNTIAVGPSGSTTTVDVEALSTPDNRRPRVDITDISFNGHIAHRRCISLVSTDSYDCARALQDLPDLDEHHARIYDIIAGGSTSSLASHLEILFNTTPRNGHSLGSPLGGEGRKHAQGTVRSQWSRSPGSTSPCNPLVIPCTNFFIRKQYHDLELAPSTALISCRAGETNKLLVLYERPYSADEELMSMALGQLCPDIFEQSIPPDDGRPRVRFVKLLLLVLFHHHIDRLSSICRETFPSSSHEMLYEGIANIPKTISQSRNCMEFHQHICQLTNMAEFTAKNLEIELEPLGSSTKSLMEYILEIRYSSAQLIQMSQDNMDRYQHGWDAYRELLNVHGSQDVKRLTILATIFLPLSLPSSILAMNTRFADLGLLLYDFVGVFFIIGSLALIIYIVILVGNKSGIFVKRQLLCWVASKDSRKKINTVYLSRLVRDMVISSLSVYWIGLTTLFVFGMFSDRKSESVDGPIFMTVLIAPSVVIGCIALLLSLVFLLYWLARSTPPGLIEIEATRFIGRMKRSKREDRGRS